MKALITKIHHFIFRHYVYTAKYGFFRGFKLKGRMPWFQKDNLDEKAKQELQFFETLKLNGKVIYDIGAHIGSHTMLFRRLIGTKGKVYAFEPNPSASAKLESIVSLNQLLNIHVVNYGLGDKEGIFHLTIPNSTKVAMAGTMVKSLHDSLNRNDIIEELDVKVLRLDDWIIQASADVPDLIKMDVEGFELNVLKGARVLLQKVKPMLFIEMHGASQNEKILNAERVIQLLSELDYQIWHLETEQWITSQNRQTAATGHLVCTEATSDRPSI